MPQSELSMASHHLLILVLAFLLQPTSARLVRSTFIIHMNASSQPTSHATRQAWYSATLSNISPSATNQSSTTTDDDRPKLLYTFLHALTGFAATLTRDELRALEATPGFLHSSPDLKLKLHTTHTPQFLVLDQYNGLWQQSSYGDGTIIGVVDSGVWPESPSFNDDDMQPIPSWWKGTCEFENVSNFCNKKLIGARHFNVSGGATSPRDDLGHGTMVSSVAAGAPVPGACFFGYANGTAVGVAPRARISVYNVAGRDGSVFVTDVLAAVDAAIADDVNVITIAMSYSVSVPLSMDPLAAASFSAIKLGIPVVFSAGNSGPSNYTVFNDYPWALTVGASSVDRQLTGNLNTNFGGNYFGVSLFPLPLLLVDRPLFYNSTVSLCNSSELISQVASGKIVVCDGFGGHISPFEQIAVLKWSGAATAAVLITEDAFFLEAGNFDFPAIAVDSYTGQFLINVITRYPNLTATMTFQQTRLSGIAAAIGSYSSRGPSPRMPSVLKPDLVAPGTRILTAWPPKLPAATVGETSLTSLFAVRTGTSVAAAHVAGVIALLRASGRYSESPAALRSALMTTAYQLDEAGPDSPLAVGAGHVDPNEALGPGLVYDASLEDYVRFLCSQGLTSGQITAIVGFNSFNCSGASADLNYPSFIAFFPQQQNPLWPTVRTFERTVTDVRREASPAVFRAIVQAPAGFNVTVTPEELVFIQFPFSSNTATFEVSIEHIGESVAAVSSGSLTWVDEEVKYRVRSPIVVVTA